MSANKYEYNRDDRYNDDFIDSEDTYDDSEYYDYDEDDIYENSHGHHNRRKKSKFGVTFKRLLIALLLIFVSVVFVSFLAIPEKTNFLIMATDEEGTRTDTIMIISFDKKSDSVSVLSVPRDTYVTVSDELYNQMSASYPEPGSKSMKINAVHHFSGEKKGPHSLVTVVESLLDIDIHYYARVNFDAFKYIIDSIGGIDFYVPCDMVYNDPVQNLNINISEGQQILNGTQAEQVVRFRSGYANADLGRIEVQQDFMKAFIAQAVSPKTVLTHPIAYLNALFKYIDTDFGIVDLLSYVFVVMGVDTADIQTQVVPGTSQYRDGQSVYIPNVDAIEEVTSDYR